MHKDARKGKEKMKSKKLPERNGALQKHAEIDVTKQLKKLF